MTHCLIWLRFWMRYDSLQMCVQFYAWEQCLVDPLKCRDVLVRQLLPQISFLVNSPFCRIEVCRFLKIAFWKAITATWWALFNVVQAAWRLWLFGPNARINFWLIDGRFAHHTNLCLGRVGRKILLLLLQSVWLGSSFFIINLSKDIRYEMSTISFLDIRAPDCLLVIAAYE